MGIITHIEEQGTNKTFQVKSPLSSQLKVDQSLSHNGVCLTVEEIKEGMHRVTAIEETLLKTNLVSWQKGDLVNLERCMMLNGRLDGHIVQGHVDQTAVCTNIQDENGSWIFTFEYDASSGNITVEKGSVCVNGISLTVMNSKANSFSVAIIPYTFEHTNLHTIKVGDTINLEFDIIGKYIARILKPQLG